LEDAEKASGLLAKQALSRLSYGPSCFCYNDLAMLPPWCESASGHV